MRASTSDSDLHHLLLITVGLWSAYLVALAAIDWVIYQRPLFGLGFYLLNELAALLVLVFVIRPLHWPPWEQIFLPLVICLLSIVPLVTANLSVLSEPLPGSGPEAVTLRLFPLLLMALVLTAWRYGWTYVAVYTGAIALMTLGLQLSFYRPGGAPLTAPVTMLLIQTVSFLVVGYFVSILIRRMQEQQASLARANAQLADYASTLEELTVTRERNHMARELHDTLAHTLSGLAVQLETVRAYWEIDGAAARKMLDEALVATRSGLQETRRALKSLRSGPLQDLGLALALRALARETAERGDLALRLALPEYLPAMSLAVEQCIFRVAQEATTNAVHHAQAKTLVVRLTAGTAIVLQVIDDGVGFDVDAAPTEWHYGLVGMRERAHLVGGELLITSGIGHGTEVKLVVPPQTYAA